VLCLATGVREWTASPFSADGSQRVIRGGSSTDDESLMRAAARLGWRTSDKSDYLGFRCAKSVK